MKKSQLKLLNRIPNVLNKKEILRYHLAETIGVSLNTAYRLYNYETLNHCKIETLVLIADALGVRVSDLYQVEIG